MDERLEMRDIDLDQLPIARSGVSRVPVIDLARDRDQIIEDIDVACRTFGFFQVVGHKVPSALLQRLLATSKAYFGRPCGEKCRHLRSRTNPWGYYDRELTKERRDRKEIFDIGPDAGGISGQAPGSFGGLTPWPIEPDEFEPIMREWFQRMTILSQELLEFMATMLLSQTTCLRSNFAPAHSSFLRLNHYPTDDRLDPEAAGEASLGIHHHTDAGVLTVLLQDGVRGLQMLRNGFWHDVRSIRGALTFNIGDMMQVWSNDLYKAPIHRVLAMSRFNRYSAAFFYNPSYQSTIAPLVGPPLYKPINWGEFRRRRADGDFADYGVEAQISDYRLA